MKAVKKVLSILLTVVMLSTSLVFAMPTSSAATYPNNLYNGSTKVNYTSSDAARGKYLVEIDAVKYNPNLSVAPEAITSEAGDIIITYRPDNGTAPEVTSRFEECEQNQIVPQILLYIIFVNMSIAGMIFFYHVDIQFSELHLLY